MTLVTPVGAVAFQDVPGKTGTMPGLSDKDIAACKARGLVWVDRNTNVNDKGGKSYGKTGRGEFMPEDVAKKSQQTARNRHSSQGCGSGAPPREKPIIELLEGKKIYR